MGLSNDLMSQFAKATVNKTKETETTVYGVVKEYDGKRYVMLDGSDRLIPLPPSTADAMPDDRVSIKIKNHTATITGNVSSPAARVGSVDEINGKLAVYIPRIDADHAVIENLDANYAKITELDVVSGRIDTLEANDATINNKLTAKDAEIESLKAKDAELERLSAGHATITDLEAVKADIKQLDADYADIDTLIFGGASGNTIHSNFANMVIAQLGDAQIKSAMIESVAADKILAGKIITNNVTVESSDGKLLIANETIQIRDENRPRVQIGEDTEGDYSIYIWDAEGNLMFDAAGITESAVKKAIIKDNMVADDANISATKIDIESLFTEINNSTKTIKSSKIYLDDEEQTLEVAFKQMETDVSGLSDSVSSQETRISTMQGEIETKVSQQEFDDTTGTLSTNYSTLKQTVDGIDSTVASHTTQIAGKADNATVTAVTDRVSQLELDQNGFKTTVSETYATKEELENVDVDFEIGGRNLLVDTNTSRSIDHLITWNPDGLPTDISCRDSETDIVTEYSAVIDMYANFACPLYVFYKDALRVWLKPNTDYVVSFDILFQGSYIGDDVVLYPQIGIGNTQGLNMQAPYVTASGIDPYSYTWGRVTCNLRTNNNIPADTPLSEQALSINFGDMAFVEMIHIKNLKLEEGTKATAWTPAPEDHATKSDLEFEIGGRNYLVGTSEEMRSYTFSGWQVYLSNEAQNVTTFTVSPDIIPKLTVGQKVTLSAFIENTTDTNDVGLMLMLYTQDTDSGYRQYTPMNSEGLVIAPGASGTAYITTTLDVSNVTAVAVALRHNSGTASESTVNVRSLKLELGDRVTDWTPAPEDTDNALTNLSKESSDSVAGVIERVVLAESTIQQLKDCISMLVVDENGTSLLEQTSSGWTFNLEEIRTSLNSVSQNMDTLVDDLGSVEAVVDALDAAVSDLGQTAEYVKIMTYESEPCIALGKKDCVFKLLITNTRIMFLDGDNAPTYINTTGLVTENITVKNELIQNGWVWKVRSNGNYGLIWRGDS